jgi:hypothetical protein
MWVCGGARTLTITIPISMMVFFQWTHNYLLEIYWMSRCDMCHFQLKEGDTSYAINYPC